MSDKCLIDPARECYGLKKAREIELDLNELRKQNSSSHERIFTRLGEAEKKESVLEVQHNNVLDKLENLSADITELKTDSKEIVSKLPPLTHRIEKLEGMSDDIEELKEKPAKRYEKIIETIIGLVVAAAVGYALAAIGL